VSGNRARRAGGEGKPAIETQPGLLAASNNLVQSSICGAPEDDGTMPGGLAVG
jgi:hypothetical protein